MQLFTDFLQIWKKHSSMKSLGQVSLAKKVNNINPRWDVDGSSKVLGFDGAPCMVNRFTHVSVLIAIALFIKHTHALNNIISVFSSRVVCDVQ